LRICKYKTKIIMNTIDPAFKKELQQFGMGNWNECFHCGNCTAVCAHSGENTLFPRNGIRAIQMGLKQKIHSNLDPWLCYYCGDCTETCPRNANPAEVTMTLRRYLTSVYDWTGISKLFYTKKIWEFLSILIIAALVILAFIVFLPLSKSIFTNPEAYINQDGGVRINSLVDGMESKAFIGIIETGDLIMAGIVGLLLVTNIMNMWYKVILSDKSLKIPIKSYFSQFWKLIVHFSIQPKFSKCDDKRYWYGHFLLMSGYTIMFIMIVALLPRFQTEEIRAWYNWQRILGYYATFGILVFLGSVFVQRIRKKDVKQRYSHLSDWIFIVLLFLTTLTGILVHIFRVNGLPVITYYLYIVHLAILVPMIIVEVPFSKWSHLAYRPFAIYFDSLKKNGAKKN